MNEIRYAKKRPSTGRRIFVGRDSSRAYGGLSKRLFDIIFASLLLFFAAIPMLIAAAAILLEGGGGVIFRQERVGAGMKPFTCYKFRTMKKSAPKNCATADLQNPERYITFVGALLRRLSIDELPQLLNVIKGDMSLVGPRPVIPCEDELIALRRSLGVYSIKPGITGLAQIRGRDCLCNRRKASFDLLYLERMSLGFDIAILTRTMLCVVGCCGVREGGNSE